MESGRVGLLSSSSVIADAFTSSPFSSFRSLSVVERGGLGTRVGGNGSFRFLFSFFPFLGKMREGRRRRRQ